MRFWQKRAENVGSIGRFKNSAKCSLHYHSSWLQNIAPECLDSRLCKVDRAQSAFWVVSFSLVRLWAKHRPRLLNTIVQEWSKQGSTRNQECTSFGGRTALGDTYRLTYFHLKKQAIVTNIDMTNHKVPDRSEQLTFIVWNFLSLFVVQARQYIIKSAA